MKSLEIDNEGTTKRKGNKVTRVILALAFVTLCLWGLNNFFNKYYLVNPVTFQNPIRLRGSIYPIKITGPELDQMIDEEIRKALETPTSSPVKGRENEVNVKTDTSYTKYKNSIYYGRIIESLKERYQNWEAVAVIIGKESSFDPFNINPSSGACGLHQVNPCSKLPCELSDIECQLDWGKDYIGDRYGTSINALAFWYANGWY